MKYKLISKTFFSGKEYTVYKVLYKKRWSFLWKGVMCDGSLHYWSELHEWYGSKEEAISALKEALKKEEIQKNYPIIKEEYIEL